MVKVRLHSGPPARLPRWGPHSAGDASPLTALLLPQIFPILHPTVHRTHGGGPALRSSRRSAGGGPHGADCAPWGGSAGRLTALGATPDCWTGRVLHRLRPCLPCSSGAGAPPP